MTTPMNPEMAGRIDLVSETELDEQQIAVITGLSVKHVHDMRLGRGMVDGSALTAVADFCGVSVGWLIDGGA